MIPKLLYHDYEAAREMGVETATVRMLVRTGELGCFRFGRGLDAPFQIGRTHIQDYLRTGRRVAI